METNKTNKLLKKLKLNAREVEIEEFSDDIIDEFGDELNENDSPTQPDIQLSPTDPPINNDSNPVDNNNDNAMEMSPFAVNFSTLDTVKDNNDDKRQFLKKNIKKSVLKEEETNLENRIKFGNNDHPYLCIWLTTLAITGAPVFVSMSWTYFKTNKFKTLNITGISLALLTIYHLMFLNSALHVLETLPTKKGLFDSVWLQIYPIVFNLAVVIVNDVMWIIGLGTSCWMNDILQAFKEKPRATDFLIDVRYDYFGGEHKLIVGKSERSLNENKHKSKLRITTEFIWTFVNFFLRQIVAFGCCFSYLYVSYYLLQPIQLSFVFITEIINVLLTSFSWLTILWIYMTFCQALRWRFQHLNDWAFHFRRTRSLPNMRQFRALSSTYQHYLNTVTIIDGFFKYWIVGIFGVLFFQASLYFQYVINAFENWPPTLKLLSIPLITMPFLSALLLLIKRAADVNAESKALDEIIVKICIHSKGNIPDNLYKKMKFFMWLVSEGSSLTIFGLVNITKKFMGTAIVFIFSYTLFLHEFTPKETLCETILKNNLSLSLN